MNTAERVAAMTKPLVVIESPFGTRPDGTRASPEEVERNRKYLDRCLADSLGRGEAPFASHKIYPGVLDDAEPSQRLLGMTAGFAWGERADYVVVYADHGLTPGMRAGIERARLAGQRVEYRYLYAESKRVEEVA